MAPTWSRPWRTWSNRSQQRAAPRQVFSPGRSAVGQAADGCAPRAVVPFGAVWLDGLLLHKLAHTPDFTPIALGPCTTELLALVATDWREVTKPWARLNAAKRPR
jgi:hypothetical protein